MCLSTKIAKLPIPAIDSRALGIDFEVPTILKDFLGILFVALGILKELEPGEFSASCSSKKKSQMYNQNHGTNSTYLFILIYIMSNMDVRSGRAGSVSVAPGWGHSFASTVWSVYHSVRKVP